MGYEIRAFVAQGNAFGEYPLLSDYITVAPLNQGFWLMLNDWHLWNALSESSDGDLAEYDNVLSQTELDLVEKLSQDKMIAYIQADFVGGNGYQWAYVWEHDKLVLRPSNNGWVGAIPDANGPINTALRHIGGIANAPYDEFDSVGLGKHRNMENWFYATHDDSIDYLPPGWN